jgi:hypothetical protein
MTQEYMLWTPAKPSGINGEEGKENVDEYKGYR